MQNDNTRRIDLAHACLERGEDLLAEQLLRVTADRIRREARR